MSSLEEEELPCFKKILSQSIQTGKLDAEQKIDNASINQEAEPRTSLDNQKDEDQKKIEDVLIELEEFVVRVYKWISVAVAVTFALFSVIYQYYS
ncbi:unnamed protein product [Caenorhabditis sp. 36 PRJEB53466]|nr:unnamed protein product [Caenorhabditis sp. 36 PRJEB53466]